MMKVIISLLFSIFPGNQFAHRTETMLHVWYKIVIPWQHQDYQPITALSLESGQLLTITPQNHGITITFLPVHVADSKYSTDTS